MIGKNLFGTVLMLVAAFSALFLVNIWVHPDYTRPNFEILAEMFHSVAYESYSPNGNVQGGATEQAPPAGTIPRGLKPFPYGAGPEEAKRAGSELMNPLPMEAREEEADRGRIVFQKICSPCHGSGGDGDGPVVKRGFPPPPSLKSDNSKAIPDGEMYHIITLGRGNMPPLDVQVERDDRWRAILHIRDIQGRAESKS